MKYEVLSRRFIIAAVAAAVFLLFMPGMGSRAFAEPADSGTGTVSADEAVLVSEPPKYTDEEMSVGGYIEMPWDKNLPKADPRISFEDAKDLLVDEDDRFRDVKKGITDQEPPSSYPADYDDEEGLRAHISTHLPPLRDQSPYGTCWAHSAMAMMETYLINNAPDEKDRNGVVTRENSDYSELHLAYFYYRKLANPMVGDQGDQVNLLYNGSFSQTEARSILNFGGNLGLAAQALMNWKGAVDEEFVPYSYAPDIVSTEAGTSGTRPEGIPDEAGYDEDTIHLQNVYRINITKNSNQVKQAIMSNGIVGMSYYDSESYYNEEHNSYYCNYPYSTNHSVCIVGWDDAFPASYFKDTPDKNGAWLIRNSWTDEKKYGSSNIFTHQGYFWMSYCDKSLADGTAYVFEADTSEDYDHNYSYTPNIRCQYEVMAGGGGGRANVYTASGYETLKAISFETVIFSSAADYELDVYTDISQDTTNGTMTLNGSSAAHETGTAVYSGIYTVKLSNPVDLVPGQKYAIVISSDSEIVNQEGSIDYSQNYGSSVVVKAGESYYQLSNDQWRDIIKDNDQDYANYCINALTVDRSPLPATGIRGLKCSDYTETSVSLFWNALDGAGGYRIQRASLNSGFTTVATVGAQTVYTDTGLSSGTAYYYRVIPVIGGASSESRRSNTVFIKTAPESVSSVPSILFTTLDNASNDPVIWISPSSESIDGCAVFYKAKDEEEWKKAYSKKNGEISWIFYLNSIPPGEYEIKAAFFRAANGVDFCGPLCDPKSVTKCAAPENLVGCFDGSRVKLTWDPVENADIYTIYSDGSYFGYSSSCSYIDSDPGSRENKEYTVSAQKKINYGFMDYLWDPSDPVIVDITRENYAVIFKTNGGTPVSVQNVSVGSKAVRPDDPTRDGSIFEGWYTDSLLSTPYDFNTVMTSGKGNITLYAKWGGYSVSFAPGDGSGTMAALSAGYGMTVTLPSCTFTPPSGKKFSKWKIGENEYDPGAEITVYSNLTVTSLWTDKDTRTLSFTDSTVTKTYGDGSFCNSLSGVPNVGTNVTYESSNESVATVSSTGYVTIRGAGSATITATAAEDQTYLSASASYTLTVNKASSSCTTSPSPKSLTYNGYPQELVSGGTPSGGTMYYAVTGSNGSAPVFDGRSEAEDRKWKTSLPEATNVGSYKVYYMVAGDENHNDTAAQSVSVTISPKSLTVRAVQNTITYGDEPAGNGVSYSGFAGNDDASCLSGTISYTFNYSRYGAVGSNYKITPYGLSAGNYNISYVSGKLTVVKKEVGLEWSNTVLTYNGSLQKPTATATGLVNGDTCAVNVTGDRSAAGNDYIATASSLSNGNYKLPENRTVRFSILKASHQNDSSSASAAYGREGVLDLRDLVENGASCSITVVDDPNGIFEDNPFVSDSKLYFSLRDDEEAVGSNAEISISVRDATFYNDYIIVVTVTVEDRSEEPENPDPVDPDPVDPDPVDPNPVDPEPGTVDPVSPDPADPEPGDPLPQEPVKEEVELADPSGGSVNVVYDTVNNTYETKNGEEVLVVSTVSSDSLPSPGYEYTGKKITPGKKTFVAYKGVMYRYKTDYTISFKKNNKPGTATAVIKWKKTSVPGQEGIKKTNMDFKIIPRAVTAEMVNISVGKKGEIKKLTVHTGSLMIKATKKDYTYTGSLEEGFEITFMNNFSGSVKK